MRKLIPHITIIFVLFYCNCFSQHYIMVSPSEVYHQKGKWDNVYVFKFTADLLESSKFKNLEISFHIVTQSGFDLPEDHIVFALTGWDYNYTEDEYKSLSGGYTRLTISTENLPRFMVAVCSVGNDDPVTLKNVNILHRNEK